MMVGHSGFMPSLEEHESCRLWRVVAAPNCAEHESDMTFLPYGCRSRVIELKISVAAGGDEKTIRIAALGEHLISCRADAVAGVTLVADQHRLPTTRRRSHARRQLGAPRTSFTPMVNSSARCVVPARTCWYGSICRSRDAVYSLHTRDHVGQFMARRDVDRARRGWTGRRRWASVEIAADGGEAGTAIGRAHAQLSTQAKMASPLRDPGDVRARFRMLCGSEPDLRGVLRRAHRPSPTLWVPAQSTLVAGVSLRPLA